MTRLGAMLLGGMLIVAGAATAIFLLQRSLLFPRPAPTLRHDDAVARVEMITLSPGAAIFLPSLSPSSKAAPLFIFTHGNAELADDWVDQFDEPRHAGWAVLLVEYPGYGHTAGSPSEASIVAAQLAAYDWATHDVRIDSARIVPYGRSLGGGPAVQLAAKRRVAALVLESSFTGVRPLAARMFVPGFLMRDPFDNLAALAHYHGPLLVMHGTADQVIPVGHGRALAAALPGAEFVPLACGHNDCPRQWPRVLAWLRAHGVNSD